jgi:hypothetical protein
MSPTIAATIRAWRILQIAVWALGLAILAALLGWPEIGIHAFWNVLIPVAPALLALAPGVWRNICPLASTALFLRHTGHSDRQPVSRHLQGRLLLLGVVLLYAIVPLRHVILDLNGPATAYTLIAVAAAAVAMGRRFEWKSGWCSGICPVHPVERLYGSAPAVVPANAHCVQCQQCVTPCADSTPALDPLSSNNGRARKIAGHLMVGGFAGFIWGWFQVPDYAGGLGWDHLAQAFGWPWMGAMASLALFLLLKNLIEQTLLRRIFAAAAIACYYWYRLPGLFGFGPYPGDGMLVDLREQLGPDFPIYSRLITTTFFAWWLVGRRRINRPWSVRPEMARLRLPE